MGTQTQTDCAYILLSLLLSLFLSHTYKHRHKVQVAMRTI